MRFGDNDDFLSIIERKPGSFEGPPDKSSTSQRYTLTIEFR